MRRIGFLAAVLAIGAASAWADAGDPPSRVARLNYRSGSVSFRPGSVDDWSDATLNYPLTTGDHLWTDGGSQAELHVGSAAIRMAPETAMSFLNLDDRTVQLSVTQGSVNVRLRDLAPDEIFEVDTPNVAVVLRQPGEYRIDADGDSSTTNVIVRNGSADVTGGGTTFPVQARESARIIGTDTVSEDLTAAPPPNAFDDWCLARDRREDQAQISARYVPRDMIGYEDLDANGVWSEMPEYGWVWRPRVEVADWAPYRYGHWAWVEPWGWTWIDDAPWGFAPFHYGRWAYAAGTWVWVPGRRVIGVRPVYAPALVAFVGGPRFGISIGVGGGGVAAWFPLGPGELYRPAYHVSEVYVRNINVVHVTNVNVINVTNVRYMNMNVRGAVTAVPHETFVTARPVYRATVAVSEREVAGAQVIGTTAPVPPRRESILAARTAAAPPARFAERTVVVRTAPPPPPVPFRVKQRELEANQGRPLDTRQVESLRPMAPQRNPVVRTVVRPQDGGTRVAPPARLESPRPDFQRNDRPPQFQRPAPQPRMETPVQPERRTVEQPPVQRPAPQPRVETRPEQPRIEQRPEPRFERPTPQPRVEQRPEQPRIEQRPEPRFERPTPQPRVEQRQERPAEAQRPAPQERREAPQRRNERKEEKKEERKDK